MSKDAKAAETAEQAPPKKSKKLLVIIIAAVLVLVLAGGGAAFFLLKKSDHGDDEETAEETTKSKKKEKKDAHPVFVNLEPFTVNLVPESGDQYLQVALAVEFDDPAGENEVKNHMPKIRNNVTMLLSSKKASELLTKDGKEKLATELKDTINEVLEPPKGHKKGEKAKSDEGPVKDVLFTSFIIQ